MVQPFILLGFAVQYHPGSTVESVLVLLSVLNRSHFGCHLPARRGSATQRWLKGSARQAPGSKVARKDERAYIDVLAFSGRRTSNSASSFHRADSNCKPDLRPMNTQKSDRVIRRYIFNDAGEKRQPRIPVAGIQLHTNPVGSLDFKAVRPPTLLWEL